MKVRNGDTPIVLPDIVKVGDPITARWANGIRTAVQRLRDRTPVVHGSPLFYIPPCPFGKFTNDTSGNLCLEGGLVVGGISSILIDPIIIATKNEDGTYTFEGSEGEILYFEIQYTPNVADDVILPGVDEIQDVIQHIGEPIPSSQLPTTLLQSGIHYYGLGIFGVNKFTPYGCGNLQLIHCPGSSTVTRQ